MAFVPPLTFGAFYFVLIGATTLAVFGARRPASLRVLWRRPVAHLVMGLAMGVMVVSHFLAISGVEVVYMIAVKRTSMLFGMAYGAWLFHERGLRRHLLTGAMMVAGVGLIVG